MADNQASSSLFTGKLFKDVQKDFSIQTSHKPSTNVQYEQGKGHFVKFKYFWKFTLDFMKQGQISPPFKIPYTNNSKWELEFEKAGHSVPPPLGTGFSWSGGQTEPRQNSSRKFHLRLIECRENEIDVNLDFQLLDMNEKLVVEKSLNARPVKRGEKVDILTVSLSQGVTQPYTACATLTLRSPTAVPTLPSPIQDLPKHLQSEMVTIAIGNDHIQAHKDVLLSTSRVFRTMFDTNMAESKQNLIVLEDTTADVFSELLCYLYTEKAPRIYEFTVDLLMAAEKYELERLKMLCVEILDLNLSLENACETLVLADLINAESLRRNSARFINNTPEVISTPAWQTFKAEHLSLLAMLYEDKMRLHSDQ